MVSWAKAEDCGQQVDGGAPALLLRPVRTQPECSVQFWTPQYKAWTCCRQVSEGMKMVKGLNLPSCKERLRELGLFRLEERSFRGI